MQTARKANPNLTGGFSQCQASGIFVYKLIYVDAPWRRYLLTERPLTANTPFYGVQVQPTIQQCVTASAAKMCNKYGAEKPRKPPFCIKMTAFKHRDDGSQASR